MSFRSGVGQWAEYKLDWTLGEGGLFVWRLRAKSEARNTPFLTYERARA